MFLLLRQDCLLDSAESINSSESYLRQHSTPSGIAHAQVV